MKLKNIKGRDINPEHVIEVTKVIEREIELVPPRRTPDMDEAPGWGVRKKRTYYFIVMIANAPQIMFDNYLIKEEAVKEREVVMKELQK